MRWSFESQDAAGAYNARSDLVAHLEIYASDDSDVAAAALVFGELVGNVVRHAPGPISIDLCWQEGVAILHVRDQGPGFDWSGHPQLPNVLAESGRGLFIVQTVARSLHVRRLPTRGTEAIAMLPVTLRGARPA